MFQILFVWPAEMERCFACQHCDLDSTVLLNLLAPDTKQKS